MIEAHLNFPSQGKSIDAFLDEFIATIRSCNPHTDKRYAAAGDVEVPIYGMVLSDHPDLAIIEEGFDRAEIGYEIVMVKD